MGNFLSKNDKLILEPYAIVFSGIGAGLESKEDDELLDLFDACNQVSETNCWWAIYEVAPILLARISVILNARKTSIEKVRALRHAD